MDKLSFAAWLLRAFIDLEPCMLGPLYARGLEYYWLAFADARRPRFVLQRTLPQPFRDRLVRETELSAYLVADPRELREDLRSTRWRTMCEAIDAWHELTLDEQCRLALLLHGLCFYQLIVDLIPEIRLAEIARDGDAAELAYWRASARYMLGLGDRVSDYNEADLKGFEAVAAMAPPGAPVALKAALKIVVHKAKTGASVSELVEWQRRIEGILDAVVTKVDAFHRDLFLSRFYRAIGFLPQRSGERSEVVHMMDLAEKHALAMLPANDAQELIYLENLHPVIESRTKEALWLGDLDLALARSLRVVDLDPYDSKAWLELGQVRRRRQELALAAEAYATAATLGPPASAIGRHMAGLCFRELGQPVLAAFLFKDAIEVDPLAISPREGISELPETKILTALKEWSYRTFEL